MLLVLVAMAIIMFMWGWYELLPNFYLKRIEKNCIRQGDYCVIDVRDYILAHREPLKDVQNIPLCYLRRQVEEKGVCLRNVVVVAEDRKAAKMAARILTKKSRQPVYYVTV